MAAKSTFKVGLLLAMLVTLNCAATARAQQVTIESPSAGAVFTAGQTITVNVSVTGGPVIAVEVLAQNMGGSIVQSAPYSFSLIAPTGVIGVENIVAAGVVAPNVATISPVVAVDIEPASAPSSIAFLEGNTTFSYVGDQRRVGVMATFADGSTEDVSNSTQLTWSSDTPSVVSVDSTGEMTAQGPGTANITAKFGTQTAVLPVVGSTGVPGDLNADGIVTVDDLVILEAALGSTPNGTTDGRNLDGDATIDAGDATDLLALCGSACPALASTTTLLSSPGATIAFGTPLMLTAGVINTGSTALNGNVVFMVDGQKAISATLNSSGMATETLLSLTAGSHTLQALYTGDAKDAPSDSPAATIQVLAPVLASLAAVPASAAINLGATDQFTAYSVFSDGSVQNATGAVWASQTASVATIDPSTGIATAVAPGTTQITATLNGVTSPAVTLTVTAPITTPTITVSPLPSSITTAQSTMVTVTVSGSGATPTGSVTLTSGTYTSAATTLTSGSAVITVPGSSLAVATDTLTATYTPDSNSSSTYNSATGMNTVTVTTAPSPSFSLSNNGPITFEASAATGNTATITVTPSNGFTGAVNLTCAVTTTLTNPTSPATCSVTPSVTITGVSAQNATLTVITTTTTTAGAYAVTVTGTSGAITMPTTVTANVSAYIAPSFTLSNGGVITISSPGATTGNTTTITVMPSGGFTGNVTLTATLTSSPSGAADPPTFSFGATSPVSITGASNGTGTLTVTTTAASTGALVRPKSLGAPWYAAGGTALACLLFFGIPARRRRWRSMLGMFGLLALLTGGLVSCGSKNSGGGGGNSGTTAGSYTITVTGTSGSITETATVNLTVN